MGFFDFITEAFSNKKKRPAGKGKGSPENVISIKTGKKTTGKKAGKTIAAGDETLKVVKPVKGKRKKAADITADINEEALGFSISLKNCDSRKREALRISLDGLEIYVHRLKKKFPVTNISATGLGFSFEKPRIKGGVKLDVDIIHEGEVKAKKVTCKVMHHEKGAVGCRFVELDRAQDDAVNKLVLLGQKVQAERRKQCASAQVKPTKL